MEQITVIRRNGEKVDLFSREPFCTVKSATQNSSLMGDDNVTLSVISSQMLAFGKGDKIIVNGQVYTIRTKITREIISDGYYSHEMVFYGVMYDLMKTLYRDCDAQGKSTKSSFDLTGSIKDMVKVMIYNLNRDYPGVWVFDEANCPYTDPITIGFSRQNCLQVLQQLCTKDNFNLEFQITQNNGVNTIHIGKFGQRIVPPGGGDYFEWGKGNGLYKLKEQKVDDKSIITRLWVEGGNKNIKSDYRDYSDRLQLPYPKRLNLYDHTLADGTIVKAGTQMIGIDDDSKRYLEDAALRDTIGSDEDVEQYDIYPKRTGEVTSLVDGDLCSFIDSTMDFDLCEKDANGTKYLIAGTTAKLTFITGKLAGQEFEIDSKGGYDHATKKFKIIAATDERGLTIPTENSEAFRISKGDKYKITDITMPQSYVDKAEEELWYRGMDDFKPRTQAQAQYSLTFDRSYFLDNMPKDSDTCLFHCGDYVPVRDTRYGIEKTIRINKVTRNLMLQHDYSITLSDSTAVTIAVQNVLQLQDHERLIEVNRLRDLNKARRGWRTTEELRNMVYDTDGFFDTDNIKPNSIDTNMLTVGSKSQQFVLIDTVLQANVNGMPNRFDCSAGSLAHLTINDEEIKKWNLPGASYTVSEAGGYYLFAKCSKKTNTGVWVLTQEQKKVEPVDDPNNYYFQVGILGSLRTDDNFRDFTTTYGFTRINGNTITTGRIITSDKECYLDLDGNRFRIGNAGSSIDWNVTDKDTITLRNVKLRSDSGDTSNIGVYRGLYNSGYVYYYGDEVSYTSGGKTCTYRYTFKDPSKGNLPTNTSYWTLLASGADGAAGEKGNSMFYTFHDSQEQPATPTGAGTTGGWHTTSTANVVWMSVKSAKTITEGTWEPPFRVKGADGTSITIKGSKDSVSQLPSTGNVAGDCYIIAEYLYVWDGTTWLNVGKIKGEDGQSTYLHIKYSDDGGQTFTAGNGEVPGAWIGVLVNTNSVDSENPSDYTWNHTKGEKGTPGEPGEDGRTTYLHIKYSDNGGLSFTGNNGEDPGDWIGQYTDFEELDSSDPTMYTWSNTKGSSGAAGADASSGEYYEYRYAKNGSTSNAPALNKTATDPSGWSKTMPTAGSLEYVWFTIAKKSSINQKTLINIPVTGGSNPLKDQSGYGCDGSLGDATIQMWMDGSTRTYLDVQGTQEARIPYDLPFGQSFTLSFWYIMKQGTSFNWIINGYNGREYKDGTINVTAGVWCHLAFRFNDRSVVVFKNGVQVASASLNEAIVGFSMYDDNLFGSETGFDEIRIMLGALSLDDIQKLYNGSVDTLIQQWSEPIRVNPYDGVDGKDAVSIKDVDVEYAKSTSNTTAPTSGWQTTAPAWESGSYIWSRTVVTMTDNSKTYTNAACITGGKGMPGDPGSPGTDGVGIKSIVEQYYQSTSSTQLADGSWSTTRPTAKTGWYIWTRSVITYTNGTSYTTSPISVTGDKGDKGDPGSKGEQGESPVLVFRGTYSSESTYYGTPQRLDAVKYNGLYYVARIDVGEFKGFLPTDTNRWNTFGAQFDSVATNLLLAEGANIGDWFMTGGRIGSSMNKGDRINTMQNMYLASDKAEGITEDSGSWLTYMPTLDSTKQYLWHYILVYYMNGTSVKSKAMRIGNYNSVNASRPTSATTYVAVNDSPSTVPNAGWSDMSTFLNSAYYPGTQKCIWIYQLIYYNNGGSTQTTAKRYVDTYCTNRIELDARNGKILVDAGDAGGSYSFSADSNMGSSIEINASSGIVEVRAKKAPSYSTATSYMSPSGIFANMAGTNAVPSSTGYTHRAAIVGLGFANVSKSEWDVNAIQTMIAGVYGRASNSGTAPAFGGFFNGLYAGGLTLGKKCITGTSNNTTYLSDSGTLVIGYTSATATVYLPNTAKEGTIIFVKQWWSGKMTFKPRSGQYIYDDSSANDYYDFTEGWAGVFMFTIGYVNGVKKEAWLVSRFKY